MPLFREFGFIEVISYIISLPNVTMMKFLSHLRRIVRLERLEMLFKSTLSPENDYPIGLKFVLMAFLAVVASFHLFMALRYQLHWDEFFLLDWVYKWNNNELKLVIQTIYFRAFSWLPSVGANEVDQIIAARLVMFFCLAATSAFIYGLCRKFAAPVISVLSLLLFLTMIFVLQNGTSFRNDALAVTLLMGVLWLLMTPTLTWKRVSLVGFLIGLAGMITIKAIFYMPIVSIILFAHWGASAWSRSVFVKCCTCGLLSLFSFGALYFLHGSSIETVSPSGDYIKHAAVGSLFDAGFFPRRTAFLFAVISSPLVFLFMMVGLLVSVSQIKKSDNKWAYIAASGFMAPFFTLLFYRHGFPYFYTFMLAPASVLVAIGLSVSILREKLSILLAIVSLMFLSALSNASSFVSKNMDTQREVLGTIHTLFPTPTPYIDRCAMVSSFPKYGLFMSNWVMTDYYNADERIILDILETQQPKFILANIDSLDLQKVTNQTERRFFPEDEALLSDNYIAHWGPIYVAGKTLRLSRVEPVEFQIYIAGPYGVETAMPVELNGDIYRDGDVINLTQGLHILTPSGFWQGNQIVTLRWNQLPIPDAEAPVGQLF